MDCPWYAELFRYLPDGMVSFAAKRLVNRFVKKYADIRIEGKENLKAVDGPTIFICNHLSNSDGVVLNEVLKEYDVTFVAGVKLSQNNFTNLGRYVIKTISIKPNSADKEAMTSIVKTLKQGHNIFIFPEGTRSRTGSMIEARKGILLIQKLSKANIVPIGIWGSENLLPINTEDMGKEKFHHAQVNVNIGKPIHIPPKLPGEEKHEYENRAMNSVMHCIAELLPEKYKGVYSIKKEA